MEHTSYVLSTYRSVDRIQAENVLRTQFRILKNYLIRRRWRKISEEVAN